MSKLSRAKHIQWGRRLIQFLLVVLVAYLGLEHQFGLGGSPIDAYCPFGGVESFYTWITTGKMIPKTAVSNLILLGSLLIVTLVAGGFFCGWLCPVGAVQDWLYGLRRKVFKKPLEIPRRVDRVLRYLRYVVLALVLYMTIANTTLWFESYDPFKVLFHFKLETTAAFVVLGAFLLLSLLIERFWCKYLCPLGAILSPLAKIGLIKVKTTQECAGCNLCLRQCHMGLEKIGQNGCTQCLECVTSCPTSGKAVTVKVGQHKSRTSVLPLTGIALGGLLILMSMGSGLWATRTPPTAIAVPASATSLNGNYPPVETITGMSYLDEVATLYGLTPEAILTQAGLDQNQAAHQPVRDITKNVGKEVDVVREAVKALVSP